jgi:hypothetical protein
MPRKSDFGGFFAANPKPKPPASPPGFKYPNQRDPDARANFARNFTRRLAAAGGANVLARELYGESTNASGRKQPRNAAALLRFADGQTFPRQETAELLAAYFKIPVSELFAAAPAGPATDAPALRRKSAPAPAPPALPLPKGAAPPKVAFTTHPGDPRFVRVRVSGTIPIETALSLVAMLAPERV